MTVELKQDTFTDSTRDGKVCGEPPPTGFLVGRKGKRITDETAAALGLVNGYLPGSKEAKAFLKAQGKSYKAPRQDKSGRRTPAQGKPLGPETSKEDRLVGAIAAVMREVEEGGEEVRKALLTDKGIPDSRVLMGRIEQEVSAAERDAAWETYLAGQEAAPDASDAEPGSGGEEEAPSSASSSPEVDNMDDPI